MRFSIIGALALVSVSGVTYADSQKPTIPKNVSATALSDSAIRITWSGSVDNVSVDGYNVYRNDRYYATVHDTTNYIDTSVSGGQTYEYAIVAFDDARNYTILSDADEATAGGGSGVGAAPRGTVVSGTPGTPGGLRTEARGKDRISVFWNDMGARGYNVYRDGSYRTTVRGTSWTDTGLEDGREYRYQVVAFGDGGKYSAYSGAVTARTSGDSRSDDDSRSETSPPQEPAPSAGGGVPSGYRLVFSEEFNGGSIDSSKWNSSYRWGPNYTINNEQQYYVDHIANPDFGANPFKLGGGKLEITASRTPSSLKSSANNKSYLSGTLTTYNKFKARYGYFEMRAKVPKGQGLWPAFWLLNHYDNGSEPEIDIMEFLGNEADTVYQVYHYKSGYNARGSGTMEFAGPDFTNDFHTFGMKWEPNRITWYVDGREVNRYEGSGISNEEMYIIVNLALGGGWGGPVNGSTPFPARYTIDYIRAYKR